MDNPCGVMILVTDEHQHGPVRGPLHIHMYTPITLANMSDSYDMVFCLPGILLEDDSFDVIVSCAIRMGLPMFTANRTDAFEVLAAIHYLYDANLLH